MMNAQYEFAFEAFAKRKLASLQWGVLSSQWAVGSLQSTWRIGFPKTIE